jgi:DNA-binding CsgD family transcriptional regulator
VTVRDRLPDDVFSDLEQAAYEAAIIPELWPQVLERVAAISDSAGTGLVCMNERGVHITSSPSLDSARRRILEGGFMSRSGRAQGVISKGLVGVPRFLNEDDYYGSLEDAESDPIVTEVFRPEGMGWAAGWLLQLPHGDLLVMNVEQYFERGPIRGDALARLDSVYPVFARAAMLSGRADFARVRTAIETLTAVGMPAAAVTPGGRVVLANEAFSGATHVWSTRGGDRLALLDRSADAMLTQALGALKLARAPRSIPIRAAPGEAVTAVLHVVPVRRAAHDIFGGTDAIIVLSEAARPGADATLIQSLFDLTAAEISVAQAIAAGHSVGSVAAASGRSLATVRNQLRSAMAKTGCSRQVELTLLMRQLAGPAI